MTDIVDPKYRCKDCGYVHFFHQSCDFPKFISQTMLKLVTTGLLRRSA